MDDAKVESNQGADISSRLPRKLFNATVEVENLEYNFHEIRLICLLRWWRTLLAKHLERKGNNADFAHRRVFQGRLRLISVDTPTLIGIYNLGYVYLIDRAQFALLFQNPRRVYPDNFCTERSMRYVLIWHNVTKRRSTQQPTHALRTLFNCNKGFIAALRVLWYGVVYASLMNN